MKSAVRGVSLLLMLLFLWTGCTVRQPGAPPAGPTAPEEAATEIEPYDPAGTFAIASLRRLLLAGTPAAGAADAAALAAQLCSAAGLFPAEIRAESGAFASKAPGDLVLLADEALPAEAFRAVVTPVSLYLYYAPDGGRSLLYGVQFLLQQMLTADGGTLPCGETLRQPATAERTMMLDCARKQWSVGWVKNLIAQLSWMGFNALELHMTEEQGIRCDIWRDRAGNPVPDCNGNDFSFLCGGTAVSWNADYPETADAVWCRDDLTEIMDCAARFRIDLIPSVDLPGHSRHLISRCRAAQAAGLSFRYQGRQYTAGPGEQLAADGSAGGTLNLASECMRSLGLALTQAYADFFRAGGCDRFAVGADEVTTADGAFAAYAAAGGGATAFDGCIRYINELCALLKGMGYTVRANNDYLFSRPAAIALDPDLQICYWAPTDRAAGAAQTLLDAGRQLFSCAGSYCYYVLRATENGVDARDPACGWWAFHHATAERIYAGCGGNCGFDDCRSPGGWSPAQLWDYNSKAQTKAAAPQLAGAYFYLWADWAGFDTEENIFFRQDDFCLVPRMWAAGAKMWDWDAAAARPWPAFEAFLARAMYSPLIKQ